MRVGWRARWIVATLGALALALLTLNSSRCGSTTRWPPAARARPTRSAPISTSRSRTCPARTCGWRTTKARSSCSTSGRPGAVRARSRSPGSSSSSRNTVRDGLQVIGVSVDDTAEMLRPYVKDMKMNYPVLQGLNHDDIQNAYGPLYGIPVTVLISRDAKICVKHSGISSKEKFEKEIKSLL